MWFLSQLSGEYLGSLESAAIDNFEDTDMDMILYLWRANKMRKTKVACFSYKKHDDIYVSNISFSTKGNIETQYERFCRLIKTNVPNELLTGFD